MAGYNYGQAAQRNYEANQGNYPAQQQPSAAPQAPVGSPENPNQLRVADPFQNAQAQADQVRTQAMDRSNRQYQVDPSLFNRADLAFANDLRGRQLSGLDAMQAAYQGPSVAARQYAANLAQAQRQAMGVAAQSRGAGRGAARLQAVSQFGGMAGQQAAQMAALEADERQRAMLAYQQALSGARQQDTGFAGLGLQRDAALENAQQGAFNSTTNAQHGALGLALQASGLGLNAAQAQAEIEAERKRQENARKSAWMNFLTTGGMVAATALGGPAGGAAAGLAGQALKGATSDDDEETYYA